MIAIPTGSPNEQETRRFATPDDIERFHGEKPVHFSAARAAGRWVSAFAGTAVRVRFHSGWVSRAGQWTTRNDAHRGAATVRGYGRSDGVRDDGGEMALKMILTGDVNLMNVTDPRSHSP